MEILLSIGLGIIYSIILGLLAYVFTISIIPEKFKNKFFSIVPFFPKKPYSIILYLSSGLLYSIAVYAFDLTRLGARLLIIFLSIIASSLFVKFIAKLRKDNLEETYEEEIKRKRNL